MRRKMARSAPAPPFGPPGVAAVVRAASLACQNAVPKLDVRLADPCARSRTRGPHAARPPQVGTANRSVLKLLTRTPILCAMCGRLRVGKDFPHVAGLGRC